ncbi:MAG: Gfo/Idh/MocA family oxidoreductase [Planctomycetes bacterium]|nr:Gfo/Idh/MocA family oxidoreductase [Planctomycetota bacterium]
MRMTRRDALKRAAAALAAPAVIRATALGAEGQPPASERIVMGIIGCGNRGGAVIGALAGKGAQVVAASDCYRDRRERMAARFGGEAHADFRELLERDDIEAVLVATPEHWHALCVIEACRHGKDVFCEKPLSLTIREAQAMVETARRYERVVQVGTQQRSDRLFRRACELVRNGRIGDVKTVFADPGGTSRICSLPGQPVPDGFDWDRWLGPAPWAPYHPDRCTKLRNWWNWRDYSGGLMTDRGAHDFDIVQWGLGMDGSGPVEVFPPDGGDHPLLTYRYANGVILESGEKGWGSRGALVRFTGTAGSVSVWRGGLETDPPAIAEAKVGPDDIRLEASDDHERDFLECVRSRRRPVADVAIGASSVNVCHIGNIARWLGRPLRWDPEKREFPGDEQANRLTGRPMREPWRI